MYGLLLSSLPFTPTLSQQRKTKTATAHHKKSACGKTIKGKKKGKKKKKKKKEVELKPHAVKLRDMKHELKPR